VTFAFILAEKAQYPVRTLCAVLGVSPSGYYAWHGRPVITPQVRTNRGLRVRIRAIHAESRGRYGSPRVHKALQAAGERVGRNRVIRLMRAEQLRGRPHRRFRMTTQPDPAAAPAPNLLNQVFRAAAPNRVWTADITAIPTGEGWLYLAVLLDLYSRRVVGWAVRPTLETELVCAAWQMALGRRRPGAGLLHHSDRGCQYTSDRYQALLRAQAVTCSMSRRGNCFDNAPTESFFRTLKVEIDAVCYWATRRAAAAAIAHFIEGFYNMKRLHSSLNYQSPAAFETRHVAAS
jgi:transposase InsO family protein